MPETWKSRAERVAEEKKGLNYILEFVLDLGENSPLSLALKNLGITSPLDLIGLSYENIKDLVYNEVEEGTENKFQSTTACIFTSSNIGLMWILLLNG